MIVKTILHLMNLKKLVKIAMWLVLRIIWNVNQLQFVSNPIGFVTETTIVVIIQMKMNSIAVQDPVHPIPLDVLITDAFQVGKISLWSDLCTFWAVISDHYNINLPCVPRSTLGQYIKKSSMNKKVYTYCNTFLKQLYTAQNSTIQCAPG